MRLGAKLMAAGIVLTIFGLGLGITPTTTSETKCEKGVSNPVCYEQEVVDRPLLGPIALFVGSFLFGGGWGGWVGTYDSDKRFEERFAALEASSGESDDV